MADQVYSGIWPRNLEQRRKKNQKKKKFRIKSLDEKLEFKGTKTTKYLRKVFLIKVVSENGFGAI
jgi:hypothetical protein